MTAAVTRDWPQIIREIKAGYGIRHRKKLTSYKLGKIIKRDAGTVRGWEQGSEPRYSDGAKLLDLHREYAPFIRGNLHIPIGQAETA